MCDMINSHFDNVDYGYDQISFGPNVIDPILKTLDTNSINKINPIRERELRMFNKLNTYKSSYPLNTYTKNLNYSTDLSDMDDYPRVQHRSNNHIKNQLNCSNGILPLNDGYPMYHKTPPESPTCIKKNTNTEEFHDISDTEYLQAEICKAEEKNNMLLLFIFFLITIITVQYLSTSSNNMRILLVPPTKQP